MHVVGIDELNRSIGDLSNAVSDLVRPRSLPGRIDWLVAQTLVELIRERLALVGTRRNEIAAGRDPDSLASIWSQVEQQLSATVEMLEDECRSRGIDPTTIEDWERSAPCEELEDQASEYVMALLRLVETLRGDSRALASLNLSDDDLAEISGYGYLIAGKLGRVASYLTEEGTLDGDVAAMDGAPNLILLSRVLGELDELLPAERLPRPPAAYLAAREDVRRRLEPLLAAVPAAYNAHVAQLVRLGRAPSPFCVATPGS